MNATDTETTPCASNSTSILSSIFDRGKFWPCRDPSKKKKRKHKKYDDYYEDALDIDIGQSDGSKSKDSGNSDTTTVNEDKSTNNDVDQEEKLSPDAENSDESHTSTGDADDKAKTSKDNEKNVKTQASYAYDTSMNCIYVWDDPNEYLYNKIECSVISNANNHPAGLLTAILTIIFVCYCGLFRKNNRTRLHTFDPKGEYTSADAYGELLHDLEDYSHFTNGSSDEESVETIMSKWSTIEGPIRDIEDIEVPDYTDDNELSLQEVNG